MFRFGMFYIFPMKKNFKMLDVRRKIKCINLTLRLYNEAQVKLSVMSLRVMLFLTLENMKRMTITNFMTQIWQI